MVIKWKAKRNGVWYPEDRLRATLFGAAVLIPLSTLGAGWTMELINGPVFGPVPGAVGGFGGLGEGTGSVLQGRIGLGLCMFWLFINGVGVDVVLSPSSAYIVDVLHDRSAEGLAANA